MNDVRCRGCGNTGYGPFGDMCRCRKGESVFNQVLGLFKPNPEFDQARAEANLELLALLGAFLRDNPHLRFGQALNSLGMLDQGAAMVEPQEMLKRAKKIIRRMNAKDQKA